MKTYLVGGAIRNEFLGIPAKDNDYVVTGATEQEMLDLGYEKVGADFPVFLHKDTGEEYAIARRERSTGPGYNDFEVDFSPDVTIEEDLGRRDFTMNAIARDIETDEIIDPYDGRKHIKERRIEIVHEKTFIEDPVRILRLARFTAQYPAFQMGMKASGAAREGDISKATSERVQLELIKALMGVKPSEFFTTLRSVGQLEFWFPEIYNLIDIPAGPIKHHAEGDAYTHTMMVLDSAAKHGDSLEIRFGCLVHDFGKASTWPSKLPSHPGHEQAGVPLVNAFCDRLKISNDLRQAGVLSANYHGHVHKADIMKAKTYVRIFEDFKRNEKDSWTVARVAWHDNEGKLPYESHGNLSWDFHRAIQRIREAKLSAWYTPEEIEKWTVDRRKEMLHKMRLMFFNNFKERMF
jgi:tRNA nucleotidyltransferase (CCA-adding enzyme)